MQGPTRADIIKALPSVPEGDSALGVHVNTCAQGPLTRFSADAVYPIPLDLLNRLAKSIKDWFGPGELELEHKMTRLCDAFGAVAIFQGQFVRHAFIGHPAMHSISDAIMHQLGWDALTTREDLTGALDEAKKARAESVLERREAYLGWLMTYPAFLDERDALRSKWQDTAVRLSTIPPYSVLRTPALGEIVSEQSDSDLACISDDFTAFFARWDLFGLTTWDLPNVTVGNFGCPARFGTLTGVEDSPTVQLPRTLRLPVRFPLNGLLQGKIDDHLSEWRAVEDQRHPDKLNYVRLRRVLHLHFLRNIVLGSGYRDRFYRRIGALDETLADYLGENEETVRKLRQWIDRRL